MAYERNISIVSASTAGIRITLCSTAYNGALSCTSYPVFSASTTEGTSHYAANSPLRQPLAGGSILASNSPSVAYNQASGTALVTFTYGSAFSSATAEYESGASPRRYRYIVHTSEHSPATAYSASVSASTAVLMYGSVDMRVVSTANNSFASVCSDAIEGGAGGGL